jgi:chromosome transmission fidelity protein 1
MLKRKREEVIRKWEEREARLERLRAKENSLEGRASKRKRIDGPGANSNSLTEQDDDEWLLNDQDASDDQSGGSSGFSKETRALMDKLGMGSLKSQEDEQEFIEETVKVQGIRFLGNASAANILLQIYYTSRTHSQLTQFISELRRPSFPPSFPESLLSSQARLDSEIVKHLPLSSRQRLCINPSVSRLGSLAAINDKCAEMQQSKSNSKCQFVPNADNIGQTHQFRDGALATLPDIEDLFDLGKKLSVCPYYASRSAIPGAEIITLPYPLLLQKTARDALGIKLEGNVVIIDEAHNIMDAVANVYAAEIGLSELKRGRQMLGVYVKRFGKKLKGENRVMVAQVARVVDGLSEWLNSASTFKVCTVQIFPPMDNC